MSITTKGPSVDTDNILYQKRGEDIVFRHNFAAQDGVSYAGIKVVGALVTAGDVNKWDSGEISGTVAGDGSASATLTIPSATTLTLEEGTYYVDFFFYGDTLAKTATPTYILKLADGPVNL